jgi:hypothetical protein
MPPVSDIAEKMREQAGNAAGMLKELAGRAGDLIRGWGEKLWDLLPQAIREKLPWLEGKIGFILAALVLALIILLLVLIPASRSPAAGATGPAAAGMFRPVPIPPDELFLPEEPDLLPGVILERERRDAWTAEDAEPYWYNPLEQGEEEWRERVEQVIDELLERVP